MNGTFAAAILAGGKSKRFGSDKAFHKIQNTTLWEDQVEKVSQLMPSEIIISSNENQSFNTPHKIIVDSVELIVTAADKRRIKKIGISTIN